MITFKRYKRKLKVVPMGSHTIVQVNGKPMAYLDDIHSRVVEITPTSNSEMEMIRYAADSLGYSYRGYLANTYEEKVNLKRLQQQFKGYELR